VVLIHALMNASVTCARRLEWDAAHRVLRHESKCASLHGHRYAAEIECAADELDFAGRVIDFGAIKQRVGAWIDQHWDHTTLVNRADVELLRFCEGEHERFGKRAPYIFDGEPTAENIALELLRLSIDLLQGTGIRVVRVRIYETPNCFAEARP